MLGNMFDVMDVAGRAIEKFDGELMKATLASTNAFSPTFHACKCQGRFLIPLHSQLCVFNIYRNIPPLSPVFYVCFRIATSLLFTIPHPRIQNEWHLAISWFQHFGWQHIRICAFNMYRHACMTSRLSRCLESRRWIG
jgi:hypothetical protein